MLSIHIQEVADFPPEPLAETCCCHKAEAEAETCDTGQEDASGCHASPDNAGLSDIAWNAADDDQEAEHGYSGQKPEKMTDDVNYNFHDKMRRISDTYDMYVDFLGTAACCPAPWTCASKVVKAKKDVDNIARRLDEQMVLLELEVARFSRSVSDNVWHDWYYGIDDMTAYSVENLSKAFGDCGPDMPWMDIYDSHHFVRHLQKTLPATLEHAPPADEKLCEIYAQKLIILLNSLASTADWDQSMHFAIFLKTKVLRRRSNRWFCIDGLSQQDLLTRHVWNAIRQGRAGGHIQYWDFASAWRELWADWQTWNVFERIHICASKHRDLLLIIYQLATSEVRWLCRFALQKQQRLPTELVLLITEHTILASGLPPPLIRSMPR